MTSQLLNRFYVIFLSHKVRELINFFASRPLSSEFNNPSLLKNQVETDPFPCIFHKDIWGNNNNLNAVRLFSTPKLTFTYIFLFYFIFLIFSNWGRIEEKAGTGSI